MTRSRSAPQGADQIPRHAIQLRGELIDHGWREVAATCHMGAQVAADPGTELAHGCLRAMHLLPAAGARVIVGRRRRRAGPLLAARGGEGGTEAAARGGGAAPHSL